MTDKVHNVMIVGVGGQGVLLASEIISDVAVRSGMDVKKSEVHGMSQRGGVVTSHVRIGKKVYSPLIQEGETDFLMAFEQAEGLRAINWMCKDGIAIISRSSLVPAIVTSSKDFTYPDDAVAEIKKKLAKVIAVDADKIAGELGNPRLVNTILIGVLSNCLPFEANLWVETIKSLVKPKLVDINLMALERGRQIKLGSGQGVTIHEFVGATISIALFEFVIPANAGIQRVEKQGGAPSRHDKKSSLNT